MPRKNQMLALMELAAERSTADIHNFIMLAFGGLFFLGIIGLFTLLNLQSLMPFVNYELPQGAYDLSGIFLIAAFFGVVNAFAYLAFAFILACLMRYTISFVILCYHYDNESWEIVKQIQRANDAITEWFRRDILRTRKNKAEYKSKIQADITRIKNETNDL